MPSECRQPNAGDEAHGYGTFPDTVIPGWSEGPDPEFRDSGFDAAASPRNDERTILTRFIRIGPSIRFRQAQHLLGNKAENELRADRRDARDQGFTQVTLDVKFLGVAEAAMR